MGWFSKKQDDDESQDYDEYEVDTKDLPDAYVDEVDSLDGVSARQDEDTMTIRVKR